MARDDRILAIDIGATSIKLCEFDFSNGNTVALARFAHREYEEELSEATRMGVVSGLLRQMLAEGGFTARKALVCMSGQSALMKFNRLPTVDYDKKRIRQLADFEVTQNIPFPLSEVLMDYQLIPTPDGTGIDMMSVVIKNDIVEQFTSAISQVGLMPVLIDVAPAACYNAVRANGLGDDECVVILNIGGRVSNLLIAEGDRFYARTIPIAGYTITQQIAKEFGIGLPEAEELKRHHGFVALGEQVAQAESETAANVSKIVRNVMSRLNGEIQRTINVYRAQQKGNKPSRMYLTGGSSILTYCDTFFQEKMGIPVEYFNPFHCVTLLPSVDRTRLAEVAHMFSEAIGVGLRYATQCPVELSLIPASIRRQQTLDRKKPFFIFSAIAVIVMLFCVWFGIKGRTERYEKHNKELAKIVNANKPKLDQIEAAVSKTNDSNGQFDALGELLLEQAKWPAILNEIYRIKPDNLWLISIRPIEGEVKPYEQKSAADAAAEMGGGMGDDMFGAGGPGADMFAGAGAEGPGAGGDMFGAGGGGAMGPTVEPASIGGLEIIGCSAIPDRKGVTFRLGKEFEFPFKVDAPADDSSEDSGDANTETAAAEDEAAEEAAPAPEKTANEKMSEAMKKAGKFPEQAFLAALRKCKLFDPDETMTALTYVKLSDTTKNFSYFRVQVKFNNPVEYNKVSNPNGNGGMNGGMDMMGPGLNP